MHVKITPEFYAERLADFTNFKEDEAVLQLPSSLTVARGSTNRAGHH
jgi:hypothetical protein